MPSQSSAKANAAAKPTTSFQSQYHGIKFGRIKQQDKLKFCPFETLVSIKQVDQSGHVVGLGNNLPWAPAKSVKLFNQKSAKSSSQTTRNIAVEGENHLEPAKNTNSSNIINSNNATSKPTGPSGASKPASAKPVAPTSWSALLKSSSGPSDAAATSSAASTPSMPRKKRGGNSSSNGGNVANDSQSNPTTSSNNHTQPGQKKSSVHIEKWRIVNTIQKGPPIVPRGLINNGNTCFMNSILQPLLHTPPFYLFLMGLYQRGGVFPPPDGETPVLESMISFAKEFRNSTDQPDAVKDSAFSCDYVFDALRKNKVRDLLKGQQEDAQEFLGFLLDAIHEELLLTIDRPTVVPESGEPWTEVGKKNKLVSSQTTEIHPTQITRIFSGMYRFTLNSGSNESVSTEHFNEHFISIPNDDSTKKLALEEMMREMCKAETVHLGEQGQIGTKVEQFERLPPVFMIGLKRFHSEDGRFFKVERHIDIPHKLDIPRECMSSLALAALQSSSGGKEDPTKTAPVTKSYQLYAVIQHHGKSIQGGHYTADILHQSGNWLRFDDSSVSPIDASVVTGHQKDRQPYILFYINRT